MHLTLGLVDSRCHRVAGNGIVAPIDQAARRSYVSLWPIIHTQRAGDPVGVEIPGRVSLGPAELFAGALLTWAL